jgi:Ca2+-binding EF-hand superfamily protein
VLTKLITDMGGDKPTLEEVEDIMYDLDVNGDGQISKDEFQILMERVI